MLWFTKQMSAFLGFPMTRIIRQKNHCICFTIIGPNHIVDRLLMLGIMAAIVSKMLFQPSSGRKCSKYFESQ